MIAHLVKANMAPEKGTGWHRHEAEFQIVFMTKGWAKFMYGDQETLVEAGDCVHQRPGIVHYLFDYSPDMEYLEIVGPGRLQVDRRRRRPARCRAAGLSEPEPARAARRALRNPCRVPRSRRARSLAAAIHSFISGIAMMVWQ